MKIINGGGAEQRKTRKLPGDYIAELKDIPLEDRLDACRHVPLSIVEMSEEHAEILTSLNITNLHLLFHFGHDALLEFPKSGVATATAARNLFAALNLVLPRKPKGTD